MALLTIEAFGVRLPNPYRAGQWVDAVDRVDLRVEAGSVLVIIGEAGAGKSLLMTALVGLLPAGAQVRGSITWADPAGEPVDLGRVSDHAWRAIRGRRIGWWSQQAMFTATRTIRSQLVEAAPRADPDDLAGRCRVPTPLLDRRSDELSGGELRRVAAMAALLHEPPLLLADEPTAGLGDEDAAAVTEVITARRREGATTVVVTHDLDLAEAVADTVAVMRHGRVLETGSAGPAGLTHPYSRALVAARAAIGQRVR
ncbi:ATP-binding cassette domain-containing protein [Propionibacteriaceae bacterium Y2011]